MHGSYGVLYRRGETVVISLGRAEHIASVVNFWSIPDGGYYRMFVECKIYRRKCDGNGTPLTDIYSGHWLLDDLEDESSVIKASLIERKIMLYRTHTGNCIAIDHNWTILPETLADLIVPFYPVVGDMVIIKATDDSNWMSHIISVNTTNKTVKIKYYVEDKSKPGGLYFVPFAGRPDTVEWDCILGAVDGELGNGHVWKCHFIPNL